MRAVALRGVGDARGVLAEGHVAAVVRAVLDRIPVPADNLQQPRAVIGVRFGAGDVVGVFLFFFYDPATFQILPLTPDGDELPTAA